MSRLRRSGGRNDRWETGRMTDAAVLRSLRNDIDATGYYPELVADAMATALGGEVVQA